MNLHLYNHLGAILSASLILAAAVALCADRGGRRINNGNDAVFKSPCGTSKQVSKRVGGCMEEIFELIEGRFPDPKDDNDMIGHCQRFNVTERCARSAAKDCLSGLHKTATGAVSSASRRWRLNECKSPQTRGKYVDALKCTIRRGPDTQAMYKRQTGMLQGIRDLNISAEQKLVKMCCLLNKMDAELIKIFDKDCPKARNDIISIVHALTDDARNTLCLNSKCEHALDDVMNHKYKPGQNFIEPVMEILFQIQVN